MTDYIDATRDDVYELYDEPDSIIQMKLFKIFPEIKNSPIAKDTLRNTEAMNRSFSALANQLMKESIKPIEDDNTYKNSMIKSTYWYNPVTYAQNQLNKTAQTHYQNYHDFRDEIQASIDKQIQIMVPDIYNVIKVDKQRYLNYTDQLSDD